jgi:tripeptidyl-peptidase-1
MAVSDPVSPMYGKHWTADQVVEFFAPAAESVNAVKSWLAEGGIGNDRVRLTNSKLWLEANVSVSEAEGLLKTEYHVWEDKEGSERIGMYQNNWLGCSLVEF